MVVGKLHLYVHALHDPKQRCRQLGQETELSGPAYCLRPVGGLKLAIDACRVGLYRASTLSGKLILGEHNRNHPPGEVYEIKIKEPLGPSWSEWFDDFTVAASDSGETRIVGFIRDQTALHGLLARIRDLNLTLVTVRKIAAGEESG